MGRFFKGMGVFLLMLALTLTAVTAYAQEAAGLNVTIQADKPEYRKGDVAKLVITVENTTDHIAADVVIENLLPNGLVYAQKGNQGQFRHAEIAPHTSVQHEVLVKVVDTAMPQTGDATPNIMLFLMCALVCAVLIGLLRWRTVAVKK